MKNKEFNKSFGRQHCSASGKRSSFLMLGFIDNAVVYDPKELVKFGLLFQHDKNLYSFNMLSSGASEEVATLATTFLTVIKQPDGLFLYKQVNIQICEEESIDYETGEVHNKLTKEDYDKASKLFDGQDNEANNE